MEWVVTGSQFDLGELAKTVASPDLTLAEEDGRFVIRSSRFDPTADAATVREQAEELIKFLAGVTSVLLGRRQPLGIGSVCRLKDNGTKEFYEICTSHLTLGTSVGTVTVTHSDGTEEVIHAAGPAPKWIQSAIREPVVAKVLTYLSGTLDRRTLYNIHETIERDMGGESKIQAAGWATKKEQNRFTHTANSYHALGADARHSREDQAPPANPMTLSEATAFIKSIASAWLTAKAGP